MKRSVLVSALLFTFLSVNISIAEASIILKVMAINPSKAEKQKVPLRAYLPKEIKPEDIIDKGDLEVAYDNQQGSYYVYGEYELAPGETVEQNIEMKDIWAVSATDMESLRQETDKTMRLLENTDFRERANFLKQSIESKLKQIEEAQKTPAVNPERHISLYRDNIRLVEAIQADLLVARSLLAQAKPIPPVVVWRMIMIIVAFLGVIGLSSYFIWQMQSKPVSSTFDDRPQPASSGGQQQQPEKRTVKEKKEVASGEIEKIIKGGGK
jgi:hypothetical protein